MTEKQNSEILSRKLIGGKPEIDDGSGPEGHKPGGGGSSSEDLNPSGEPEGLVITNKAITPSIAQFEIRESSRENTFIIPKFVTAVKAWQCQITFSTSDDSIRSFSIDNNNTKNEDSETEVGAEGVLTGTEKLTVTLTNASGISDVNYIYSITCTGYRSDNYVMVTKEKINLIGETITLKGNIVVKGSLTVDEV